MSLSGISPNDGYSSVEEPLTYSSTNAAGPTVIITATIVTTVFPTPTVSSLSSSSSSTPTVSTTYVSTNAAGSTVVASTSTVSTQSNSSSSTPIAVIVGGIVGGVVLAVIVLLIFFIRRRSSKSKFDGVSEPLDRVINRSGRGGTLPELDLSDEANNITPFDAYAADGDEGMRQYDQLPFASRPSLTGVAVTRAQYSMSNSSVPPSSMSYGSDGQLYLQGAGGSASDNSARQSLLAPLPQGAALPAGQYAQPKQLFMHDTAPADWHVPRPGSSLPPSTVPSASASSGSAKEREVTGERGAYGLTLAFQCEPRERSESPPGPARGIVVVHQDAGRAPEETEMPQEIPPAYDSIQH
ncbi:hypothetical protein EDD16DRAFT_119924 [Pisolithus croceorrhizus]|nr:hypothetical protein EDD16DRAFT_119924 [Pisolithus croceorrhizus]